MHQCSLLDTLSVCRAALPVSSDRAVGPGCLQLHEEPSFDEEPPEDTEGVPTALLLDPITQHVHKGRYKAHPVGTDPRMDKIFMPSDSKMINHPGTQARLIAMLPCPS